MEILTSHSFQVVMVALLAIDILLVIAGLIIEIQYQDSKIDDLEDALRETKLDTNSTAVVLQVGSHGNSSHSEDAVSAHNYHIEHTIDHAGSHTLHQAELMLVYLSSFVLSIFVIEGLTLIWGMGFFRWFKANHKLYVADFVLVVTSLVLELVLLQHKSLAGLLIIGRSWRVLRIVHGVKEYYIEKQEWDHERSGASLNKEKVKLKEIIRKASLSIASSGGATEDIDEILASGVFDLTDVEQDHEETPTHSITSI